MSPRVVTTLRAVENDGIGAGVGGDGADAPDDGKASALARGGARRRAHRLLRARLRARLGEDEALWLEDCLGAVAESDPAHEPRTFELALALAPRRLGQEPLIEHDADRERFRKQADACLGGWDPASWSLDEATRALLLTVGGDDAAPALFARAFGDTGPAERPALLRTLPLLPGDDALRALIRRALDDGRRTTLDAIAGAGPWPAWYLDDEDWNRLVLAALASERAPAPIHGLDERANAELAPRLIAHALARRAAARPIPPALWRALGPFGTAATLAPFLAAGEAFDVSRRADDGDAALRLAVSRSADPALVAMARRASRPPPPGTARRVAQGRAAPVVSGKDCRGPRPLPAPLLGSTQAHAGTGDR